MIARLWFARAAYDDMKTYLNHFSGQVLPELKKCDGFASAMLLTRDMNGEKEIAVTTFWNSLEAIDAFAGSDRDAAVVAPEAAALLKSFDHHVRHYTVDVADLSQSIFAGRG